MGTQQAAQASDVPGPGGGREAEAGQVPRGAEADWQVREWVGKAGAGPGAAGGCGPASPPPPRDYLVPAAAMSPGRNVPPQIMLFISLGGSAARQHQAPGGRCARSPALPSSPCAAATAAPGLGVAALTAPAQVSPGRVRQPEEAGCGCGCARLRRAARGQRRRWAQGARDARGPGDWVGAQPRVPGVGTGRPWRLRQRTPRGAGIRVGFGGAWRAGRLLWRAGSWSVARGRWQGGEGVRVLVRGCLLQDPGVEAEGVLLLACPTSAPPGFSAVGLLRFSSGELVCALPGQPSSQAGRTGQGSRGRGRRAPATTRTVAGGGCKEEKIRVPQAVLRGRHPFSPPEEFCSSKPLRSALLSPASPVPLFPTTWP